MILQITVKDGAFLLACTFFSKYNHYKQCDHMNGKGSSHDLFR